MRGCPRDSVLWYLFPLPPPLRSLALCHPPPFLSIAASAFHAFNPASLSLRSLPLPTLHSMSPLILYPRIPQTRVLVSLVLQTKGGDNPSPGFVSSTIDDVTSALRVQGRTAYVASGPGALALGCRALEGWEK